MDEEEDGRTIEEITQVDYSRPWSPRMMDMIAKAKADLAEMKSHSNEILRTASKSPAPPPHDVVRPLVRSRGGRGGRDWPCPYHNHANFPNHQYPDSPASGACTGPRVTVVP